MQVKLGDRAKDIITGYRGIVVAITDWLMGCKRITIQSEELKDGSPVDSKTFDVGHIEVLDAGAIQDRIKNNDNVSNSEKPGGPRPEPSKNSAPK